jgi:hypothetical protein
MLSSDFDRLTPIQRLFVEQALVMAKEMEVATDSAPAGQIIDRCESFMLGFGRDFLRRMLESPQNCPAIKRLIFGRCASSGYLFAELT